MTAPASPATASRPDVAVDDAPAVAPPRPFALVGALLAGLPTALFSTVLAAAVAVPLVIARPAKVAPFVVVGGVAAAGLAVFVRRWWLALRELDEQPAWAFLLVPFFVVGGVAGGVAFALALPRP